MKLTKLSLVTALALGGLLACSSLASAQETNAAPKKGKGGMSVEQRLERMKTTLNLTDEQVPKVKAVLEETGKKMREAAGDREQMRGIRDEELTKMKGILTPDQFEKYKAMAQRGGKKGPGGPGGPAGEKKGDGSGDKKDGASTK